MDFAENYTCRKERESQAYHWCQKQITIFPMMAYYYSQDGDELELHKEAIVAITDDNKHDAEAVSVFQGIAVKYLRTKKQGISFWIEWSDGCPGHFKGKNAFKELSKFPEKHSIPVQRNIFGEGHGKNPCDGIGGTVKSKASRAVLRGEVDITCAEDLTKFSQKTLSEVGASTFQSVRSKYDNSHRTFIHVPADEVHCDKPKEPVIQVKTLPGTRDMFCIATTDTGLTLNTRKHSCFCRPCKTGEGACENAEYAGAWEKRKLERDQTELRRQSGLPVRRGRPKRPATEPAVPGCKPAKRRTTKTTVQLPVTITSTPAHNPIQHGTYVAVPVRSAKGRTFLYIAVVSDINLGQITVKYLKKVSDAGVFKEPLTDEYSTESVDKVLFVCPEPQVAQVGTRIRYLFEFTDEQKAKIRDYTLL